MKSILQKKEYYLVTHPDLAHYAVENYGDRVFILRYPNRRVSNISSGILVNGDEHWPITEDNILKCADALLEEELNKVKKEQEAAAAIKKKVGLFKRLFG